MWTCAKNAQPHSLRRSAWWTPTAPQGNARQRPRNKLGRWTHTPAPTVARSQRIGRPWAAMGARFMARRWVNCWAWKCLSSAPTVERNSVPRRALARTARGHILVQNPAERFSLSISQGWRSVSIGLRHLCYRIHDVWAGHRPLRPQGGFAGHPILNQPSWVGFREHVTCAGHKHSMRPHLAFQETGQTERHADWEKETHRQPGCNWRRVAQKR